MKTRLSLVLLRTFGACALLLGCGGDAKKDTKPTGTLVQDDGPVDDDDDEDDDGLVPEEKFDEIKNTFERKATTVARCFPEAVDSGEVEKTDRIKVTVSVEIQKDGSAKDLQILGTSKRSKTLESCVLTALGRWQFTSLPKPITYSYSFVLQRL